MTKKCPSCNQIYHETDLGFCVDDGQKLVTIIETGSFDSAPTIAIPKPLVTQEPVKNNNFFMFTTIALSVVVLSGIFGFILYYFLSPKSELTKSANSQAAQVETKKDSDADDSNPNLEKETPAPTQEKQPVVKVTVTPPSSVQPSKKSSKSKLFGLKRYNGNIGGQTVVFNLNWNKDSSIAGNYYFADSPGDLYNVSGSNYAEGRASLSVSNGANKIGTINLYKRIEGKTLCWQGTINPTSASVRFCRRR